jgi:hypothetical protein
MHLRAVEHTIRRGLCTHHAAWVNHTENRCRAPIQLPWGVVLVLQALVFASAAAGLVAIGHRSLALVFGMIVVINAILIYVWVQ